MVLRPQDRQGARADDSTSGEQIQAAKTLATVEGRNIDFRVAPAEEVPFPDGSFDVITANQCWLYFDKEKAIREARRVLVKGGLLVTSHFSWLPRLDRIAAASEELVLKYNPQWSAADYTGEVPPLPKWAEGIFNVKAFFYYDEAIHFTREIWRGRIRACRGIGAALSVEGVQRFGEEHENLLKDIAGERFAILHRDRLPHVRVQEMTDCNNLPPRRALPAMRGES